MIVPFSSPGLKLPIKEMEREGEGGREEERGRRLERKPYVSKLYRPHILHVVSTCTRASHDPVSHNSSCNHKLKCVCIKRIWRDKVSCCKNNSLPPHPLYVLVSLSHTHTHTHLDVLPAAPTGTSCDILGRKETMQRPSLSQTTSTNKREEERGRGREGEEKRN